MRVEKDGMRFAAHSMGRVMCFVVVVGVLRRQIFGVCCVDVGALLVLGLWWFVEGGVYDRSVAGFDASSRAILWPYDEVFSWF